ncbi:T cell receptor alpha chain MC.7.G5-like [Anolis carolinensis]|uniref:T cell receptor alpha chain MC.7.G5-like n=1 Tax=Anolis carolinensis TaxID=28377 RepID=UPI002F2B191D
MMRKCTFIWWRNILDYFSHLKRRVGASVDQMDGIVTVTQGGHISIDCHYEMSSDYRATPFWYIQPLGEHPRLLLSDFGNGNLSEQFHQGFEAKHERKNKTYNLEKKASQLNDSAVYFCACNSDYVGSKLTFGRGTNLKVIPDLDPSPPSVYKLKPSSEEKQGKAACLYTDYSPNPLKVGIRKEDVKDVNGSVVVVKEDKSEKGAASYGLVLWDNDDDNFHCPVSTEDPKGDSDTCLEEDGGITFETDERLNLLSLTVLGLRVIFLKTVSFNLLFTFRLWSR